MGTPNSNTDEIIRLGRAWQTARRARDAAERAVALFEARAAPHDFTREALLTAITASEMAERSLRQMLALIERSSDADLDAAIEQIETMST